MKNLLTLVSALFFVTIVANAQTGLIGDPYATVIGNATTTTHVEIDVAGAKKGTDIANEIVVWRTSQGTVVISVNTNSIVPTNAGQINEIPTKDIYKQISKAAVAEAIRLQHITANGTTKVVYESMVQRSGVGANTRFAACGDYTGVARDYSITFSGGVATIVDNTTTTIPTVCSPQGGLD